MSSKISPMALNQNSKIRGFLLCLCLFLLAFCPRAYDLQRFVTADEAKWVYRSAQFLLAFGRGDFPGTSVNLTPAVTTTWLGSLGLLAYYQLNQTAINLPLADWLASLPEFRVELGVLVAARWPMVILTSLGVVAIYLAIRGLFQPSLAFLAAAFIALDPHPLALSRIIGHDAPTVVFMTLSLLLLLCTMRQSSPLPPRPPAPLLLCSLSAVAAGLAFLSKAPALFLIPFAGLVFVLGETNFFQIRPLPWPRVLRQSVLWLAIAYLTFVAFWPAAWVDPIGRPLAVFENAFLSATDQEEADEEGYWRVPDLGPFYYVVNGAFKLSPLVMVGAGLAVVFLLRRGISGANNGSIETEKQADDSIVKPGPTTTASPLYRLIASPLFWLLVFVILFTIFMTVSDKRSPRYILPIFPPLAVVAAWGWLEVYRLAGRRLQVAESQSRRSLDPFFVAVLTICAAIILWPYSPYYLTYYNPLVGGPFTAPGLVKIGWGEGLDWVGRFLQREDNLRGSRVGTAYASTVAPFFEGSVASVTSDNLDYLVLYRKQVQSGEPSPAFIRYFEQTGSIFSVELNGIPYADVYPGPTLHMLPPDPQPPTPNPHPIGFRPLTLYGHIGGALDVDVVWQTAEPSSAGAAVVGLVSSPAISEDGETAVEFGPALVQAESQMTPLADDLLVSHHHLSLPEDLPRGIYTLVVNGRLLGEIELRRFQAPKAMAHSSNLVFADQIALAAYQFEPATDYLGLTIAWQAQKSHLPDYTVFAQILDAETNERLAGVDTPPLKGEWPTSRWVKDEVVVDEYLIAIPPGFPPGYYKVIAGLYLPETGQRLTLPDGQDHWTLPWTFIRK